LKKITGEKLKRRARKKIPGTEESRKVFFKDRGRKPNRPWHRRNDGRGGDSVGGGVTGTAGSQKRRSVMLLEWGLGEKIFHSLPPETEERQEVHRLLEEEGGRGKPMLWTSKEERVKDLLT